MRKFVVILLSCISQVLLAQTVPPVVIRDNHILAQDIGPFTEFVEDKSDSTLPLSTIQKQHFQPFTQKRNERATTSDRSLIVVWLRFRIHNTHPTDTLQLFYDCKQGSLITVYENNRLIDRVGFSIPRHRGFPNNMSVLLRIPAGQENTYYVQTISYITGVVPIASMLYSPEGAYKSTFLEAMQTAPLLIAMAILAGSLLFMSLFAFYQYRLTLDKAFLYYALYTLTSFYLALGAIDSRFGLDFFSKMPLPISLLTLFYTLFASQLLAIKQQFPRIWQLLRALILLITLEQAWTLLETIHGSPLFGNNTLYLFKLAPAALITCVLLGAMILSQLPIKTYLLVGIGSMLCLTFVPLVLNPFFEHVPDSIEVFVNYPPVWALLGLSVEGLCFAMALAYRGRLIELENASLHTTYTQQLKDQLAQRTEEIQTQSRQLEEQHIRQLELGFEQKVAETEMTALRAQMNPHFIFNCLNSIKLYATDNDAAKASDYLTRFSRLIRLVLENSRSERVTLQNELDALQLYLEMEAMRFKEKLRFHIEVPEQVDSDFVEIPPLLLQPYVENAIWHGLMHKLEGGMVWIRIEQLREDSLRITISDDGIGRAKAADLKSKSAMPQKSFGMKVTGERIALINQLYQTHTQVQIHDLIDSQGQPAGTEVVLEIPI